MMTWSHHITTKTIGLRSVSFNKISSVFPARFYPLLGGRMKRRSLNGNYLLVCRGRAKSFILTDMSNCASIKTWCTLCEVPGVVKSTQCIFEE